MRRLWFVLLLWFGAVSMAHAGEKPLFAPPPAWVKVTPMPKPGADTGGAFRMLLMDQQVRFGPDRDEFYQERAVRLLNAQALTSAGTIALPWNPELSDLIVHKVQIRRGESVIDILATQQFTILRRETNLQFATLDGLLTATLQIEGLQVGDILDVAYTVTRKDPALKGRSDTVLGGSFGVPVDHLVSRVIWAEPKVMTWKTSGGMDTPVVKHDGKMTELLIDKTDAQPAHAPEGAPVRYRYGPQLQISEFQSWSALGALMAPLYAEASTLKADSPIKDEAAAIRAATSDPKARATAALLLVERKTRYLFLGMHDGGLVPAAADDTWARRFGDCKGKTVLLLALLHELGIQAEPALVSTTGGDGLDTRLPGISMFDHVMVRATIGGQTYWMDGTRIGDHDISALRIPSFHYVLPLRNSGSALVKLSPTPLAQPETTTLLRLDASAGLDTPATAHAELIIRGDTALTTQIGLSNMAAADKERALRSIWEKPYPWMKVTGVTHNFDEKAWEEHIIMDGVATLDWRPTPGGFRWLEIPESALGWDARFKRDPGPGSDAPFAVPYPTFTLSKTTVSLPRGGVGFTIPTADVDLTVAGRAMHRHTRIDAGVATIETSIQSLTPEFPASEAVAAAAKLIELSKAKVNIRAPAGYVATDKDIAALTASEPTTVEGYVTRGNQYSARRDWAKARADFDKAIALDPKSSAPVSNRGLTYVMEGRYDLAKADFEAASALNHRDIAAVHGMALLAEHEYRLPDAIVGFSRAIDLKDGNLFALNQRMNLYRATGQFNLALADLAEMQRLEPTAAAGLNLQRAGLLIANGDDAGALAALDAAAQGQPPQASILIGRASILTGMGRKDDAEKAIAEAIKLDKTPMSYLARASRRPVTDTAGRLADIDAALKLDPKSVDALTMRAEARIDAGQTAQAIADLNEMLKATPENRRLLLLRAKAYAKSQQVALADKDLDQVRGKTPTPELLNELCWTRATLGIELDTALADCTAAVTVNPYFGAALDSQAFVLLRLGRAAQSVASYDAALKLLPKRAESLFGRGLAKLRLNQTAEGQVDLAAARARSPVVEAEYASYGLKP